MSEEFEPPTRFRILIIGRANAGKTTILRAVCGTEEEPDVYDEEGRKLEHLQDKATVDPARSKFHTIRKAMGNLKKKASLIFLRKRPSLDLVGVNPRPILVEGNSTSILLPSSMRGLHNIKYSLVFPSNPELVFHDSRGFESGATDELELVRKFIQDCAAKGTMEEQLHAIWCSDQFIVLTGKAM